MPKSRSLTRATSSPSKKRLVDSSRGGRCSAEGQGQGTGDAREHRLAVSQRQRAVEQAMVHILQPLHGQKALSIGGLSVGDIRDDGGVVKLREQLASREKRTASWGSLPPSAGV